MQTFKVEVVISCPKQTYSSVKLCISRCDGTIFCELPRERDSLLFLFIERETRGSLCSQQLDHLISPREQSGMNKLKVMVLDKFKTLSVNKC